MKLLKQKILFILGSETDFLVKQDRFEYYPYQFFYWRLKNFQPSSVRDGVLQLIETGEVDKIVRNGVPFFRLTSQGRHRLLSFFTLSWGQKRVWDRKWKIAVIKKRKAKKAKLKTRKTSVKEIRRIRIKLKKIGFKKLARGVYITPLPISQKINDFYLKDDFFSSKITVIESRRLLIGDNEQLAKDVWQLDLLLEEYKNFITKVNYLLASLKKQKSLTKQAKNEFFLILNFYFALLKKDPGLPKKLLSRDWPADLAKERFLKLALKIKKQESR